MAASTAAGSSRRDEHVLDDLDHARDLAVWAEFDARYRRSPAARDGRARRALEADAEDAPVAARGRPSPRRCRSPHAPGRRRRGRDGRCRSPGAAGRIGRGAGDQRASQPPSTGMIAPCRYFAAGRGEEDGGAGDVVGLAPAAGGDALEDRPVAGRVGAQGLGVVGLDVARRDGVHVDALRRPFVGEELRQARRPRAWTRCRRGRGCRPGTTAARRC